MKFKQKLNALVLTLIMLFLICIAQNSIARVWEYQGAKGDKAFIEKSQDGQWVKIFCPVSFGTLINHPLAEGFCPCRRVDQHSSFVSVDDSGHARKEVGTTLWEMDKTDDYVKIHRFSSPSHDLCERHLVYPAVGYDDISRLMVADTLPSGNSDFFTITRSGPALFLLNSSLSKTCIQDEQKQNLFCVDDTGSHRVVSFFNPKEKMPVASLTLQRTYENKFPVKNRKITLKPKDFIDIFEAEDQRTKKHRRSFDGANKEYKTEWSKSYVIDGQVRKALLAKAKKEGVLLFDTGEKYLESVFDSFWRRFRSSIKSDCNLIFTDKDEAIVRAVNNIKTGKKDCVINGITWQIEGKKLVASIKYDYWTMKNSSKSFYLKEELDSYFENIDRRGASDYRGEISGFSFNVIGFRYFLIFPNRIGEKEYNLRTFIDRVKKEVVSSGGKFESYQGASFNGKELTVDYRQYVNVKQVTKVSWDLQAIYRKKYGLKPDSYQLKNGANKIVNASLKINAKTFLSEEEITDLLDRKFVPNINLKKMNWDIQQNKAGKYFADVSGNLTFSIDEKDTKNVIEKRYNLLNYEKCSIYDDDEMNCFFLGFRK